MADAGQQLRFLVSHWDLHHYYTILSKLILIILSPIQARDRGYIISNMNSYLLAGGKDVIYSEAGELLRFT